jgi:hypothetical protein
MQGRFRFCMQTMWYNCAHHTNLVKPQIRVMTCQLTLGTGWTTSRTIITSSCNYLNAAVKMGLLTWFHASRYHYGIGFAPTREHEASRRVACYGSQHTTCNTKSICH